MILKEFVSRFDLNTDFDMQSHIPFVVILV